MTEFSQKQQRVRELFRQYNLDALLLQRVSSFAWATCGAAAFVNTASTYGAASLLITPTAHYVITDNIEATRLQQEEKLSYQGWEFHISPWHERQDIITHLTSGLELGSDGPYPRATDLSNEIAHLRANLTSEEGVRFRVLGRLCAEAVDAAVRTVQPGQTEHEIAGRLAFEALSRGVQAIVILIAADERVFSYRHPLPTYKSLERYAMLVLCGRRWGLVSSITRFVHFGRLPDDLRHKAQAVASVDAALIASTRPGISLGEIFARGIAAYSSCGYAEEWQLHHQGGPAGYEPREYLAFLGSSDMVSVHQVYAWNPSIAGTKSEDTIQVGEHENEVLTAIPGWPTLEVEIYGQTHHRPAILEIT